jgi:hypothetical protein
MAERPGQPAILRGRVTDARGRTVTQLDPVAMYLLHRHDVIAADDLRTIATALDPDEMRRRRRAAIFVPICIVLCFAGFFGYFHIFNRWRGWDPVLIMFATGYFIFPLAALIIGFRKARRARWQRTCRIMLHHRHCPHCGYPLQGLPDDTPDGATVCPECGCAWILPTVAET